MAPRSLRATDERKIENQKSTRANRSQGFMILAALHVTDKKPTFAVLILGTRSSRGVLERKEVLLTTLSSYSLQHEMGRVFRGRVLSHRKSKRRQVEIGEQCFPAYQVDRSGSARSQHRLPKPNEKHGCQQASAATILVILPTAGSPRAVFFRRRCSLSFIISFKSATCRISIGPSPYLKPGCCEIS